MNQAMPEQFWEKAGEVSYAKAMFADAQVEQHVNRRMWQACTDIGFQLGMTESSRILDLGCGDGAFANRHLSRFFEHVDGYDLSAAAVERANAARAREAYRFHAADVTQLNATTLGTYDGMFMIGILHHVKSRAASVVKAMAEVSPRIVVLEPNGSHPVRKMLELTPSYRAAGEESFRTGQVIRMFNQAGFKLVELKRLGLFPNFTPLAVMKALRPLERLVEATWLNRSTTTTLYGFARE